MDGASFIRSLNSLIVELRMRMKAEQFLIIMERP